MKGLESSELAQQRWAKLHLLQDHYRHFSDFLEDVMELIGFTATEIQQEIGAFLEHGPQYLMVQAQRGQAKTTVAAAFAVWCLVHSPAHRILIISAGGTQATEIATLIVRIIMQMDVLECLRPDKMAGDRTSVEAFDLHHSLKGLDKSPSVACVGIDSNLQGKRADLLIADDVESSKNSATPTQRAKLLHLTKDFTSINSTGRILWLGTPQTLDSIYNSLEARGVVIRVWPGRYPTEEQRKFYGGRIAPGIVRRLDADPSLGTGGGLLADQGKPVDSVILDEAKLQAKELDQGTAYFQLQHMLNTTLSDAMRYPLKPELLVMLRTPGLNWPINVVRGMTEEKMKVHEIAGAVYKLMGVHEVSAEVAPLETIVAYIDPAAGGANGDETAWAIGGSLNGNIVVLSVGGIPGGYTLDKLEFLAAKMAEWKVNEVVIEKNMGFGAFAAVWTPILRAKHTCAIEEDMVSGQKEKRIIDTLAPVMGRGALIVSESVIEEDRHHCQRYTAALAQTYSLFNQLAKITTQRDALVHDDRADALEGLVRRLQSSLARDQERGLKQAKDRAYRELTKDPCGYTRYDAPTPRGISTLRQRRGSFKRK